MRKIIAVFVVAVLMTGCEKPANVDVPVAERLPAVTCVISPEYPEIVARATWSDPLFENSPQDGALITNATITVSNGAVTKTLVYDPLRETYKSDTIGMPIVPGATYFLSFTADGKTCTAHTTVPYGKVNSLSSATYDITYADSTATSWRIDVESDLEWAVVAGEKYYMTLVYSLLYEPMYGDTMENSKYNMVITESATSGTVRYSGYVYEYYYAGAYEPIGVNHIVCVITKEYYDYVTTAMSSGSGNVFSEPQNVKSNIEGGFGVFASYRALEVKKFY